MSAKITANQRCVLYLLQSGHNVYARRYNERSDFFRAECEYWPDPRITTLNALLRKGLIEEKWPESYNGIDEKQFVLTRTGRAAVQREGME